MPQILVYLSTAINVYHIDTNSFHYVSFFNLSFSISNLAIVKRNCSISVGFLLVYNATKQLPGCFLGRKAAFPSLINSFTRRKNILLSKYAFDKAHNVMNNFIFLFWCPCAFLFSFSHLYHLIVTLTKIKSRQIVVLICLLLVSTFS